MVTQDRDEELVMFLEMRRREKEQGASLLSGSDNRSNNGETTETVSSLKYPLRRSAADNFLYSENEKSDYEWLLTPPGTPQFEKESHRSVMSQLDDHPAVLKSRLGNCGEELVSRTNVSAKHSTVSSGPNPSDVSAIRRPSSSGGLRSAPRPSSSGGLKSASRSSTPSRRPATMTTTSAATKASSSRSSTPTSRATLTAARSAGPTRSATPARSMPRPSSAQSLSATKSLSRASTPSRRPSTPSGPSSVSAKAPAKSPASVSKSAPSRGTSPALRSRPSKPPEKLGFPLDAPPNLRTTLPSRPVSASRGRPGASAPSSRSNSIERSGGGGGGRGRRQSCSPSKGRAPVGNAIGGFAAVLSVRGTAKANGESVSPVVMGTKMVERVVNMRKLAPSRQQTENSSRRGSLAGKSGSVSHDSLGYGRTLSKSSIDMALRHMDIRRSVPGNLRPLVTKVPASSVYSVRSSGSGRSRPGSVSDSPLATSSTVSSEPSVNNFDIICLEGSEAENDDLLSHNGNSSPRLANSES